MTYTSDLVALLPQLFLGTALTVIACLAVIDFARSASHDA